jgi:glycolate oxidase FAD binding subunit
VLDLQRLDRIVEYNPDDLTVSVEAGLTAGTLAARLAARRQLLPLDPPGVAGRTLGGCAATNARGPLRARYGTLRDLLLGVRFVQADGVVTWGGARVVKSVSGYDVPKLMVGALGTLGVLGELTLRLHPRPEVETTRIATFTSSSSAQAFIAAVVDSTLQPSRLEVLSAAMAAGCGVVGRAPVAVAASFGGVAGAVRAQAETLTLLARRAGGDPSEVPGFWARWERAWTAPGGVHLRVATLPSAVVATVAAGERLASQHGAPPAVASGGALIGDLTVRVEEPTAEAAADLVTRLRAVVADAGGGVVIERAPRRVRELIDPWGPVEPAALGLMRALRDEFDPRRTLNPGRFVGER